MENFNRSDAEIKTIIRLAQICCSRFSQSDGVLARNHATIRCIGNTELLGAEFQETIRAAAQNRGRHDDRILNICMAYSSQEEISNAIKDTVVEILHGLVPEKTFINPPVEQERKEEIGAITANSLSEHMYTAGCPPLDILIRTSGTTRLSDFLLWQCHEKTRIEILDKLWPDITICDLFSVILRWQ